MSTPYRIEASTRLQPQERDRWERLLVQRDFGEVAVRWCEALQESEPAGLEVHYLQVFAGDQPRALVVLHLLRRFDLSGYVGRAVAKASSWLGKIGFRPLVTDLAFIEIPISNLSGILLVEGAEAESLAIASAVRDFVRAQFKYGILCLKASPSAPGEAAYEGLGMLSAGFLDNMTVTLRGEETFEQYGQRLRRRLRHECRSYARQFAEAGGVIETVTRLEPEHLDEITRLYQTTCDHHRALGEIEVPIPQGRSYFEAIARLPEDRRRVLFARVHGRAVGFGLLVDSGNSLYFTHCGLDYERALPVRGYFNLNYAVFAEAIRKRVGYLEMGAQVYEFKSKMGAEAFQTKYYFEVTHPALAAIARLVARHFSNDL